MASKREKFFGAILVVVEAYNAEEAADIVSSIVEHGEGVEGVYEIFQDGVPEREGDPF